MCIRDSGTTISFQLRILNDAHVNFQLAKDVVQGLTAGYVACLLYTSDAADERSSVDLGGRRIIKKKN